MVVYASIGFLCIKDYDKFFTFLEAFSFAMIFKAHQAIFVFLTNYSYFKKTEYLVDHFYSAFVPPALCFIFYRLRHYKISRRVKWIYYTSMPSFLLSFILNDRRTAYAGVAFAILSLIVMTPISVIKKTFKINSGFFSCYVNACNFISNVLCY